MAMYGTDTAQNGMGEKMEGNHLEDGAVHAQAWEAGFPPGHPSR
jgi:hypothetical protein